VYGEDRYRSVLIVDGKAFVGMPAVNVGTGRGVESGRCAPSVCLPAALAVGQPGGRATLGRQVVGCARRLQGRAAGPPGAGAA